MRTGREIGCQVDISFARSRVEKSRGAWTVSMGIRWRTIPTKVVRAQSTTPFILWCTPVFAHWHYARVERQHVSVDACVASRPFRGPLTRVVHGDSHDGRSTFPTFRVIAQRYQRVARPPKRSSRIVVAASISFPPAVPVRVQ